MIKRPSNLRYLPIEDYGIIGNLHTAALVSLHGSIDFLSFTRFDAPTIFCKLLDADKGGFFSVSPLMENIVTKQLYLPDTNVLVTRFFADEGIAEVIDFMPVDDEKFNGAVIRKITTVRGSIKYNMRCAPRFNYAQSSHTTEVYNNNGIIFSPENDEAPVVLYSDVKLKVEHDDAVAEFNLREAQTAFFILEAEEHNRDEDEDLKKYIDSSYHTTIKYWQTWIDKTTYKGQMQEVVRRSALTLKLLISKEYGSMVAAPTFSLPEGIGHERNWDYRYTWIRDAAFAMHAFLQLGFFDEAKSFLGWVKDQSTNKELQLMFAIDGSTDIAEKTLEHLEGYKGSKPVRIGNGAHSQEQMDIYGELIETIYLYTAHGGDITFEYWLIIQEYVEWVIDNWHKPDHSIWEVRGVKREFLFSRMMCWIAIDRGIKIANLFSYPFDILKWHKVRDEIYYDIHENFWSEKKQSFVQYKGGHELDASTLLMPILRIVSPLSDKWIKTMDAIDRELRSDVLVYRYREQETEVDGLKGKEGTFTMCSFWHVECLTLMGRQDQAKEHFEKMLGYANHLGLFAEQIGMKGEHLGNFPQAFTHLGLISAAIELNHAETGQQIKSPSY